MKKFDKKFTLYSENFDSIIYESDKFDNKIIKSQIIKHLKENKSDCIEYRIDGHINSFYAYPEPFDKVCKLIIKGHREYYKPIE